MLGNLPRSRPGRRSEKRAAAPKREAPAPRAGAARESDPDPVGDALRTAARVVETGLHAANEVTREVLRRLPRP